MLLRYDHLSRHPVVFQHMTGLRLGEFATLLDDVVPRFVAAQHQRLARVERQRALGGGRTADLSVRDQILLAVVWLRQYPTNEVLGFLFGVSDSTVSRIIAIARVVPLLEASGRDTMRLPDPGRKHRKTLDALLADTPELAVLIDSFEQRVQRPKQRSEADGYYSGKKRQHTLKSQVAVDEQTGTICDVADSVVGPTADITLLKESRLLERLPPGVGGMGDLAYVGIAELHPQGLGLTPRRKPRGKPRPAEDVAFNRACSKRRMPVEHAIGRLRRYQCLNQTDRHHRKNHSARVRAVAGLVNRQMRARTPKAA
jgi:hypothetical protein